MININLAKNAGFCFGVKRAIEETEKILSKNNKVYCIGEIIHNEHVVKKLKENGLITINDENIIKTIHDETVIIRSHGIEKQLLSILIGNNNKVIDLTCSNVKKIHTIVDENTKNNEMCILVGNREHPEVKSIKSYAHSDIYIINTVDEAKLLNIDKNRQCIVVSQTTSSVQNYQNIIDILMKISYNIKVYDTICSSTENRQKEAELLAKNSDIVLVVGSKNSSNTKKLYEICKIYTKTYYVESVKDYENIDIKDESSVSVITGASTPHDLIEEIINYARSKF